MFNQKFVVDLHRNPPLFIFYWMKWLQQDKPSAACLIRDMTNFRHLIAVHYPAGLLACLYNAVPDGLKKWAMKDFACGKQNASRLLRRLQEEEEDTGCETDDIKVVKFNKSPDLEPYKQSYWRW